MNLRVVTLTAVVVIFTTISAKATPVLDGIDLFHYRKNVTSEHDEAHISIYYNKSDSQHQPNVKSNATLKRLTPDAYASLRDTFFRYEESKQLGADIQLSKKELQANEIIMAAKTAEYDEGLVTPHLFKPSKHFFSVLDAISASPLFKILTKMPKGAVLHAHDRALCSTDFAVELTYRPSLWTCRTPNKLEIVELKFSKTAPTDQLETDCVWQLLSEVRQTHGADAVDNYFRGRFSLYPTEKFLDNNAAWEAFMSIYAIFDGLLSYKPVWADYYYNALSEFYKDGVQYFEVRSILPTLYDMEGNVYKEIDTVQIYVETLERFKKDHPDFIGSRLIYAPYRRVGVQTIEEYIKIYIEIESKYPDFVAGFDLVGQEGLGRPLKDFVPHLLSMPEHIKFFFHAAETNWYGSSVDENLIDAVLLGTKRIGHGYGIMKHPLVLEMVKTRNIAIEVNPISNQVLQHVFDFRNHPCAHLFADNYPVVISSDDPSLWMAKPLSHDFYIAFLGIASAHADLRLLKKLAMNSIEYSSLDEVRKAEAFSKWHKSWDNYIDWVINGQQDNAAIRSTQIQTVDRLARLVAATLIVYFGRLI